VQALPSASRPFLFYHLEKSGGSTLRPHLASAALSLNQRFFIPCYDDQARMDKTYVICHR
jgi:DNA polymerase IIIc chi subunit